MQALHQRPSDPKNMFTNLFNVEVLDLRLAPTLTESPRSSTKAKWNTLEYRIYLLAFLIIPPLMFKSVYDLSLRSHPAYEKYEHLLSPGWIPGRKADNSDIQYSKFRENLPYMVLLLILHPTLRKLFMLLRTQFLERSNLRTSETIRSVPNNDPDAQFQSRMVFDFVFGIVYIVVLHGISALKILTILIVNYKLTKALPRRSARIFTWTFHVGVLFANEFTKGYQLAGIAALISHDTNTTSLLIRWGSLLDTYGGLIPRWEILFNIAILRLIAFNFDYLWMLGRNSGDESDLRARDGTTKSRRGQSLNSEHWAACEKDRIAYGATPADFTFRNYTAYILYAPLYLVGPIINFNDYIAQSRYQLDTTAWIRVFPYALRLALCLLCMEVVIHFNYAVAISHSRPNWSEFSHFQLSMLGYFNLNHIWLKLLVSFRFFRLWALVDGMDPPENTVRCMSNNYSTLAFWRGWHRSYNRFIVRYIYIPLGGGGQSRLRSMLTYLAVFTFVALWHDINLQLLVWGWLISAFILPELLAKTAFPASRWRKHPKVFRWLCGIGAVGNILMMMTAHLVGFVVGIDGAKELVGGIVGSLGGRVFFLLACITLFVGVQVMFEWRESERRRGVTLRC